MDEIVRYGYRLLVLTAFFVFYPIYPIIGSIILLFFISLKATDRVLFLLLLYLYFLLIRNTLVCLLSFVFLLSEVGK